MYVRWYIRRKHIYFNKHEHPVHNFSVDFAEGNGQSSSAMVPSKTHKLSINTRQHNVYKIMIEVDGTEHEPQSIRGRVIPALLASPLCSNLVIGIESATPINRRYQMEQADNPPRPTSMLNSTAHRCTKLHSRRQNTNSYIFAVTRSNWENKG